jgi:hypothetical protein
VKTQPAFAKPVHFLHHLAAEGSEPGIAIVTATGGGVVQVVGEQHLPHPKGVVQADHVEIFVKRIHALDIETQRELACGPRAVDIDCVVGQHEVIGVSQHSQHPAAIGRERGQGFLPVHDVEADVDADITGAQLTPLVEQIQIDLGTREYARMRVPHQRFPIKLFEVCCHPIPPINKPARRKPWSLRRRPAGARFRHLQG